LEKKKSKWKLPKREYHNQILVIYFTSFYHHQTMKKKMRSHPTIRLQLPDLEDIKKKKKKKKKNQFEKIVMNQYWSDGKK
jgi:hypothetical protein